jgi:putative glutamine amidotransferase
MMRVALPFGSRTPEQKREPYRAALAAVEIQPVEDADSLAGLDGLLLAGGSDVDPQLYGAAPHPLTDQSDEPRDALEIRLLREALERDLPVLAICRGLQLLNVALGGTLAQDIEGHRRPGEREAHGIAITRYSRLRAILGSDDYLVNSRHHQSADRVADGLAVTARAPDGTIEALEMPGRRFVLAVQWHPEDRTGGPDGKLFEAFRDALRP